MLADEAAQVDAFVFRHRGLRARFNGGSAGLAQNGADFSKYSAGVHQGIEDHSVLDHFDRAFFEHIKGSIEVTLADDRHAHTVVFGI